MASTALSLLAVAGRLVIFLIIDYNSKVLLNEYFVNLF